MAGSGLGVVDNPTLHSVGDIEIISRQIVLPQFLIEVLARSANEWLAFLEFVPTRTLADHKEPGQIHAGEDVRITLLAILTSRLKAQFAHTT